MICRYGYCLEEETAKEYLKFLVNGIKNITNRHKTISADSAHKINNKRFRDERARDNRVDDDYFESFSGKEGTLNEFEIEFRDMLNQLKTEKDDDGKRKISQEWINIYLLLQKINLSQKKSIEVALYFNRFFSIFLTCSIFSLAVSFSFSSQRTWFAKE